MSDSGALHGIRVIDLSTTVSGAWCARMLADFGSEVTLFEGPSGHPTRRLAPFDSDGRSVVAEYVLANRPSAQIDPYSPPGRESIRTATANADVLVCNLNSKQLDEVGLNLRPLMEKNDGLIVCSITPHGSTGSRSERPGNNLTASALSGWASINGLADRPPLKASGYQASYCAGTMAYGAIVSALLHRRNSPQHRGQFIDVSELEVMASTFAPALLSGQYEGKPPSRKSRVDMSTGPVPVKDGHFALTISRPHFWRDAMNVLGLDDLAEDPRWATSWYRQQHSDEYVDRAQEKLAHWKKMDLFDTLAALRVIAGPVLNTAELAKNEHLREREFFNAPSGGGPEFAGPAFKMSSAPATLSRRAPLAGADTTGVLEKIAARASSSPDQRSPATPGRPTGPLDGYRGLVLTQAWAGSYATQLLGMMGADIIQVEFHGRPDSWRGAYDRPIPETVTKSPHRAGKQHTWNVHQNYNSVNLNKRCITLDLTHPDGLDTFRRLLPYADFVAENFAPRVLGNLGLDYESLKAIKPDIILCSLSAFGNNGPWRDVPGIGGTIEPISGMSSLLGYEDGEPLNSGQMYPDAAAGINGFTAITTALMHREQTGQGQYIDLSMQESSLAFIGDALLEERMIGTVRGQLGNKHMTFAPHGIYETRDGGWIAIATESDAQWSALCHAADREDWLGDPRFESNEARKTNEKALDAEIGTWSRGHDRGVIADRLSRSGVISAPVLDAHEVAADEALRERGFIVDVEHPEAGTHPQSGVPVNFSNTPAEVTRPAPLQGQHTREVLCQFLDIDEAAYKDLLGRGVTGAGPAK